MQAMNNNMAYMPTPIRSVHVIKEDSWTRRSYKITTLDDLSCLYTVDTSDGAPQVTLTRHLQPIPYTRQASSISRLSGQFSLSGLLGQSRHHQQQQTGQSSNNYVVGTANFHITVSSKIDIHLSTNQTITMKRPDSFSSKRRFESLTPLGTLEWKSGGGALGSLVTSDLKLVDMSGRTVARYQKHSSLLSGRSDEITLFVPELAGFLDIVIITCIATIEYRKLEEEIVTEAADNI
ncbi:hypothetical protein RJZ56_004394 [Blastomyces dermatitidis]|uniref:DUF6593 domain-containing protein n=3 Tax=Blastomyces TaxID=229219 RepID=A0A179V290_BLAGS|nr:uncharacterized protein BDBG_08036 [Blastomyces gilchristii SLH14081]XP_045271516.1 uncharacterized protein BDCG_00093 [Blastomyces dermatitidis ER-3]EGE81983.1 hypothetical protein BDDG_04926 [Blastomyces dermatitidis ATCC 18188]EQL35802.1 hypothetical protein BDFG_02424 [Blastomyces dermatitidis ATCC 26199]EEQ83288.2 hypothetical protein BDCG_00093 [Blastomyces dermatitidis ER-3]OAT12722.1 hypothetical protein BDBG_08036 [Blastomyces gilchristii SLH14081]